MSQSRRHRSAAVLAVLAGLVALAVPASPVSAAAEPASFVAVEHGRVVLIDTSTGHVLRALTRPNGGQDSHASVTDDGRSVVFVRGVAGRCGDSIGIVSVSGGPVHQLLPRTRASLGRPQLSRTGGLLGYLLTSCSARRVNLMTHRIGHAGSHRIPTSTESDVLDFTLGRRGRLLDVVVASLHDPVRVWSIAPSARKLTDGRLLRLPRGWSPHEIASIGISRYVALELTNAATGRRDVLKVDGRTGRVVGPLVRNVEGLVGVARLDYDAGGHHLMVLGPGRGALPGDR